MTAGYRTRTDRIVIRVKLCIDIQYAVFSTSILISVGLHTIMNFRSTVHVCGLTVMQRDAVF